MKYLSTGTSNSHQRINPKDLKDYDLFLPKSRNVQSKIGYILKLLDKKISINMEINNDLYDEGVNQTEFFNNLSGDNDSVKIISSPLGLIYFIDDLNDSNVYVDNYSEFYGVNASISIIFLNSNRCRKRIWIN